METRTDGQQSRGLKAQVLLAAAVVLLLRLPFLNQAIQGDDVYYLAGAGHAQIEPLHPNHFQYVFMGTPVDMRGHPHPPLNVWFLGLLLAVFGDIREVWFHAAYILFSLIAALAMVSLARRFSPQPVWAILLFLAAPAFVVNGTSFESDLPFLAFWMAAAALFVAQRALWAAIALFLAALTAYQAVFLTPILAVWLWLYARRWRTGWLMTFIPPVTVLAWQIFERFSTGRLPAAVLAGYFQSYGLQTAALKSRNALMLAIHFSWLVFPALLPPAFLLSYKRRDRDTVFLAAWIALFFAGAVIVFFAGSARYLLPIAAPVALLVSRIRRSWLAAGFACQMALSLALAIVNYQHWDGVRRFAASLQQEAARRRVWINGDWGLRYYLEAEGGLPVIRGQQVQPGEIVVSSALAFPVDFKHPGSVLAPISEARIAPALPLRLIGLDAHSGYSTASAGLRPFDISRGAIDLLRADLAVERHPVLSDLPMNAPEAEQQIVSGIYSLEGGQWRWTSGRAVVLLKAAPGSLRAAFTIPHTAPARRITLLLDGEQVAQRTCPGPGAWTLEAPVLALKSPEVTVSIAVDRTFRASGDVRELGIILTDIGFRR